MFHLWLPNGVNLNGQYDWFYEGFALYSSLKLGVAVNRLRFEDFLDTLSRAYDIDRLSAQKISLIHASKNRWSGANPRVYARGMLIAFLCDVAMLDASKGKRSTGNLLRELYEKYRTPAAATDANTAILTLMKSRSELVPIIERYITGSEPLEVTTLLQKAGIEVATRDQLTRLAVVAKPSGRQKDLLDKLGYNSWRKLANNRQ
jgi:predicted metalloprotease with PDZ domain